MKSYKGILFMIVVLCAGNMFAERNPSPHGRMGRMQDISLTSILGGTLGQEYANKAQAIIDAGLKNIFVTQLNEKLKETMYINHAAKVNAIKEMIDNLDKESKLEFSIMPVNEGEMSANV